VTVYSTHLVGGLFAVGAHPGIYAVPALDTVVIRDVYCVSQGGLAGTIALTRHSDGSPILEGTSATIHTVAARTGRAVLETGDSVDLTITGAPTWTVSLDGYVLSP
jgi:hypothetical protein